MAIDIVGIGIQIDHKIVGSEMMLMIIEAAVGIGEIIIQDQDLMKNSINHKL